ncbi:MAG: phosphate acetyltransferase [Balneolaceae bacterium]
MNFLTDQAKNSNRKIVFPETADERVLKAVEYLIQQKICIPVLIGKREKIISDITRLNLNINYGLEIRNWENEPEKEKLFSIIDKRLAHKNMERAEIQQRASDQLHYAGLLTAAGKADGVVAGSVATTASVIRAGIATVGIDPSSSVVSSIFLMELKDGRIVTFADCGVVPYPDSKQLAVIAIDSARTHRKLTETEPRIAFLSFSTKGSARHENVELVQQAFQIAQKKAPELIMDGELQFDAAFVPEIAEKKAPDSPLQGDANVFIFPNLDAANIAYKITERLAGAIATGPILQGLSKPFMDLSRGCSWMDIVNAASVASILSKD